MGKAAETRVSLPPRPGDYATPDERSKLLTMSEITSILITLFCRAAKADGDTVVGAAICRVIRVPVLLNSWLYGQNRTRWPDSRTTMGVENKTATMGRYEGEKA